MEPDVTPLPSYSPPPLDGGGGGGSEEEEEEFGAFSIGGVYPTQTQQPDPSCDHPAQSSLHYSNRRDGGDQQPEAFGASRSTEETGFAEFPLLTEQAGHAWCCGFTELRDGEHAGNTGQEVVAESEPGSQSVRKANEGVGVEGERRPSQDDEGNIHCDDWSLEGATAELGHNAATLTPHDGQSDHEHTDGEVGVMENRGDSPGTCGSETDAQETSATSCQPLSAARPQEKPTHCTEADMEPADAEGRSLGSLPPSDSFADFCSAPTQDDEEGPTWADFMDRSAPTVERTRTRQEEPGDEEEWEESGQDGVTRTKASLCCQVQQLLRCSFPEIQVPAVEGEAEFPNLGALLHTQQPPETEQEEVPELRRALRIQQLMLIPPEDIHCSLGLQFKWGGSHSNTTLLRCLGVDPRNIVFIGTKKQAVTVPAYASSLGMLDPTKVSAPAVCSPERTAAAAAPSGPLETQKPSPHSQQKLPSSQPDWSCRGLSGSQEVCSSFNLDCFGSEDESRSSGSSRAGSPPPGVDRELYEIIISKLEAGHNNSQREDSLNRLMSAAEMTSVSARKLSGQEEMSAEAGRMVSDLPDLSFMQAKVLMFPVFLTPKTPSSSALL